MECLHTCLQGLVGVIENKPSFEFVQDSEQAGVEAAKKLIANFARVTQDITNPGPENIDGKTLTQEELQRVDPKNLPHIQAMVRAVCCLLLGKETSGPATPEEALAWAQGARFLNLRIHGSPDECHGREPDMSASEAAAMRTVLGRVEAASKLVSNRDTVVKDITNPGPRGVNGGELTQTHLKRVDGKHRSSVDDMVQEVCGRLFGKGSKMTTVKALSEPSAKEVVLVWAEAAGFLAARIQGPTYG